LRIARSSASELEYQILLAFDLKLIPSGRYEEPSQQITEIKRMRTVLVQKLTADRKLIARPAEPFTLISPYPAVPEKATG
jgi:hypothetical protein